MKTAIKKAPATDNSSARVVDGKLILSCPGAINPIVWQMDLIQAKASALEVRENAKEGRFTLTLKATKGEVVEIAPFATKDQAVEALMAAARALENAHGQIRPVAGGAAASSDTGASRTTQAPAKPLHRGKWAGRILGLLLVLALITIWVSLAPRAPVSLDSAGTPVPGGAPGSRGGDEPGVPLSADEFLMKRQK